MKKNILLKILIIFLLFLSCQTIIAQGQNKNDSLYLEASIFDTLRPIESIASRTFYYDKQGREIMNITYEIDKEDSVFVVVHKYYSVKPREKQSNLIFVKNASNQYIPVYYKSFDNQFGELIIKTDLGLDEFTEIKEFILKALKH